jgi:hypothetical protein
MNGGANNYVGLSGMGPALNGKIIAYNPHRPEYFDNPKQYLND